MPSLLILFCALGALAVVGGNALVVLAARRRGEVAWAFHDAPVGADLPSATPALVGHDAAPVGTATFTRRPKEKRPRRPIPLASWVVFSVCFVLYAAVGGVLVLHYGSIVGDAQSRVADAWYVLFSRDPHLAAVGFVWAPLPSLLTLPLLVFKPIWPALSELAFAGNIASAAFMAGSVVQLRGATRELGARPAVAWVLVAVFALNPMVVYYGANGMSEAFQLFFLLLSVRTLLRWTRTGALMQLAWSGSAMGLAYLSRYEALAAGAVALGVVGLVSFSRAVGKRKQRLSAAASDALIYGLPFVAAFIGWAIVSYVIVGHAFEYNSSQYGNSSQLSIVGGNFTEKALGMPLPTFAGLQLLSFAPLLPIVGFAAGLTAWNRRERTMLGVLPLAGVLGFTYLLFVAGKSFVHLRPFLPALPLALLCIAYLTSEPADARTRRPRKPAAVLFAALVAALLAVPAFATTALAMNDPKLAPDEKLFLGWVFAGHAESSSQRVTMHFISSTRRISQEIDSLHLRDGQIVVDTFTPCVSMIVMMSDHPHQYVITSDRDYERVLADPPTFHAHYLMAPPLELYGKLDAVNRAYPQLYPSGANFARKVKEFHEAGCPAFRLYRTYGSPRAPGTATR